MITAFGLPPCTLAVELFYSETRACSYVEQRTVSSINGYIDLSIHLYLYLDMHILYMYVYIALYVSIHIVGLKAPCNFELTAMAEFALLRYLSEFRLRVSLFWV